MSGRYLILILFKSINRNYFTAESCCMTYFYKVDSCLQTSRALEVSTQLHILVPDTFHTHCYSTYIMCNILIGSYSVLKENKHTNAQPVE